MERSAVRPARARDRDQVEQAKWKLKDAFEKSKSSILEEADSILTLSREKAH